VARRSRISVGSGAYGAEVVGANTLLERALKGATKACRVPMEEAMREVYAGVKRDWPRPTSANRTGNKRAQKRGFNDQGWASSGYSLKKWRWSTRVAVSKSGRGKIIVSLTNDAVRRGGRYAFMARLPYPHHRKFYWKEYALKPAKKKGRKLIRAMTKNMHKTLEGR